MDNNKIIRCGQCKHYNPPNAYRIQIGILHGACLAIGEDTSKPAYLEEYEYNTGYLQVMEEFGCILGEAKENLNG